MTDSPKAPTNTPELSAFERMKEFTRRLVSVPKSELPKPTLGKPKRPKHPKK